MGMGLMKVARNYKWLFLIAGSVFALGRVIGWYVTAKSTADAQMAIRTMVEELGGHVYFDYQLIEEEGQQRLADDDWLKSHSTWSERFFGRDWHHDVFYVSFAQFRNFTKDGAMPARRYEIGDREIERLSQLKGLKWLALSGTAVTDEGIKQLTSLPKIERLWLSQTSVTDQGLNYIASCPTLTHLAIEGTPTSDRGLAAIVKLPQLKFLSLGNPYYTAVGLLKLSEAQSLEELQLDRLPLNALAMKSIGQLKNLSQLSLKGTPVTNEGIAPTRQLTRLKNIKLDGTLISDGALTVASNWPELAELSITNTAITDLGLNDLKKCTKLRSLKLAGTACSLDGILDLFMRNQKRTFIQTFQTVFETRLSGNDLASIDLSGTRVTDSDVQHFAAFTKLEWLTMPDSELTDAGARSIAALQLSNLSLLNINGCRITDQGLSELSKIKSLRNLHVVGTRVTSEAVAATQRTNPSLRIYQKGIRKQ